MFEFRLAQQTDARALYQISVLTGNLGRDASHLYQDPNMMGHIYSVPYLKHSPELCFVVERKDEIMGFAVGTSDTCAFEQLLESEWWPKLRQTYPKPEQAKRSIWTADEKRRSMIHDPQLVPAVLSDAFPAHLHMNLHPKAQGMGLGSNLLRRWSRKAAEMGVEKVHVGVNRQNQLAVDFWKKHNFKQLDSELSLPRTRTIWLGRSITW